MLLNLAYVSGTRVARILLSLFFLQLLTGCPAIDEFTKKKKPIRPEQLVYKSFSGKNLQGTQNNGSLKIDVYPIPKIPYEPSFAPTPNRVLKPILLIHGGGWQLGSTFQMIFAFWHTLLKNPEYRVFSIEHRSSACQYTLDLIALGVPPENLCWAAPTQSEDLRDAITYIKRNAEAFQIDPNALVLIGDSAGAHLAVLHALKESGKPTSTVPCALFASNDRQPLSPHESETLRCDTRVAGVANFYGPVDFMSLLELRPELVYTTVGAYLGASPELMRSMTDKVKSGTIDAMSGSESALYTLFKNNDPIEWVHSKMPPLFASYTQSDALVPKASAQRFLERVASIAPGSVVSQHFETVNGGTASLNFFTLSANGTLNVDASADYLPHTFLYGIAMIGPETYDDENGLQHKVKKQFPNLSPPKKGKKQFIEIKDLASIKLQLKAIDLRLRKWISCEGTKLMSCPRPAVSTGE